MSLVASSISGAAYVLNNAEDKDTGNGFEFTRRKRWPQLLLQELVGSTLFCLKPTSGSRGSIGSADGRPQNNGWKVMYVSPSVTEMLGPRPSDVEGREFFDYVYGADQPQLTAMLTSLLAPSLSHKRSGTSSNSSNTPSTPMMPLSTSSDSHTTYVRMLTEYAPSRPNSSKGHHKLHSSNSGSSSGSGSSGSDAHTAPGTVVWEIRAHATGVEGADLPAFGLGGAGTMVPQHTGDEMKGKAVWLMGRRVGEGVAEGEGNGQNLDAFLELKLENEKLREELRELQIDFDDDDYRATNTYADAMPSRSSFNPPSSSSSSTPSSSSSSPASSPAYPQPKPKTGPGRPPKDKESKDKDREGRDKKRAKKANAMANGGPETGEGMHVCVTCGRTDSPEWRKGPLGPKTLCNACGLRWAKRNSTAPSRKDKKAAAAAAGGK